MDNDTMTMSSNTRAVVYEMVAAAIMTGIQPSAILGSYHQNMERLGDSPSDADGVVSVANAMERHGGNPADVLLDRMAFEDAAERTFVEAATHMDDTHNAANMLACAANHLRGAQATNRSRPRLI